MSALLKNKEFEAASDFQLDGQADQHDEFHLDSPTTEDDTSNHAQTELFLPEYDPESPVDTGQLELKGLEKPIFNLAIEGHKDGLQFHYAHNLLESLEAQGVQIAYQCRDGYCGSCRTDLIEGEVAYLEEPMAWINEGEILPCCCVPKTALKLKLKS